MQFFATSLGVGSSTLAITNFFVAIADGKIDDTERRMMGVVYVVLRVAMVLILLTSAILIGLQYLTYGLSPITPFIISEILVLFVLYINAILMTMRVMPSTFGPGLQAGSWYTLGTLAALTELGLTQFALWHFVLAYVTWLLLVVAIVNGIMAILKERKKG